MKTLAFLTTLAALLASTDGLCEDATKPRVVVTAPYLAKIGEPFQIKVSLDPRTSVASKFRWKPVTSPTLLRAPSS